jgi:hypothetical protein
MEFGIEGSDSLDVDEISDSHAGSVSLPGEGDGGFMPLIAGSDVSSVGGGGVSDVG